MSSRMISRRLNPSRSLAIDVFRGLTLAGMILVNNEGDGNAAFIQLKHTAWHGFTLADLVFPTFVFIMGVAVAFTAPKRDEATGSPITPPDWTHILKRVVILFALGLLLNFDPTRLTLADYRIPGVLQRIAVSYLFCAIFVNHTGKRTQAFAAAGLLALYWLLMKLAPVPGFGAGDLSMRGNLAAFVDNHLFPGHLYKPMWDPEGALGSIPAVSTGLIGMLTGHWLREKRPQTQTIAGMCVCGCILIAVGLIANIWFPINKNLWSPSYVLFTGGLSMIGLAICIWVVDFKKVTFWTKPFLVLGVNSITAYVFSEALMGLTNVIPVGHDGGGHVITLRKCFFGVVLAPLAGPGGGALLYAICCAILTIIVAGLLYRKSVFIKI